MSTPSGYQILAGSEHLPHPETKRLTASNADEIVTIQSSGGAPTGPR
jgi:hypothetical protein